MKPGTLLRVGLLCIVISGVGLIAFFSSRPKEIILERSDPGVPEPFATSETNRHAPTAALLGNGMVGMRLGRFGFAVNRQGESLPLYLNWAYAPQGEEKILPQRSPFDFDVYFGEEILTDLDVTNYKQVQDLKMGALTTTCWIRRGALNLKFDQVVRLDSYPDKAVATMELTLASAKPVKFKVVERVDSSPMFVLTHSIKKGAETLKYAGELDAGPQPQTYVRRAEIKYPSPIASQPQIEGDIEISGSIEDQQAVRAMLYQLRAGVPVSGPAGHPVGPMGLSNQLYNGHVFWDADIWVFPALALLYPERAVSIPRYRLNRLEGAAANAKKSKTSTEFPLGDASLLEKAYQFPWESSVTGGETIPGPSRLQHHITGTVAFAMQKAADLDLVTQDQARKVGEGAACFWLARSQKRADGTYEVKQTMSPDEHHIGDNDLYTNLVAEWTIRKYLPKMERKFYLPKDETSFLTYDRDGLKSYKQTAALLAVYPLQDPRAVAQAGVMFDRFSTKVTKRGPAMSDSIHSLIAARLGRTDEAYSLWRRSWFDFTRSSLMAFSEKRVTADRTTFITGSAGSIQAILYGFCGIEFSDKPHATAPSLALKNNRWLIIRPNVPSKMGTITIRNLSVLGKKYTLSCTGKTATLVPAPVPASANSR